MGRKKNDEERTCATCGRGPDKDECMDREDCSKGDLWFPKEPECDEIECKVSVNGGPAVPFPSKAAEQVIGEMVGKHVQQLDLEGKPLPEPDVEDDDETEVREFTIYRSNGLVFRMGSEGLEKALEVKKKESVSDSKDRIKLLVQNRSKVMSGMRPLDPNRWDAGTRAIYERIMSGHSRDA
jgi:hypothetical protein